MFFYRFGRLLQILALIDCGVALLFPNLGGMETQLQIVLLAGVLFIAGRVLQKKGEAVLRASGRMPPLEGADDSSSANVSGGNP